jgi:hypothetical protein
MEMKGKFPCRNLVCSVFSGGRGRAQRRSWTSSCVCLVSIGSTTPRARRGRRPLITMPCITPGRPRVHIRTKVLLRHILEVPLLVPLGIDLHLVQKPKLGGRYTDISHIYTSYSVGTLYIHVLLSFLFFVVLILFLLSKTQKDQKYFCCFSLLASLVSSIVCFTF